MGLLLARSMQKPVDKDKVKECVQWDHVTQSRVAEGSVGQWPDANT